MMLWFTLFMVTVAFGVGTAYGFGLGQDYKFEPRDKGGN